MTISKFYIDNLNSRQDIELCQCSKFHSDSNILPTHIHFVPWQWALPFLRYGYKKTLPPSKPNVKGIGEVKVQHRIVGPTSYRMPFLSVHTNRASYSWDMVILKFDLENSISRARVKIAFVPICACKNNRRIWRHIASASRSRDVTDQLRERDNVKSEKTILSDKGKWAIDYFWCEMMCPRHKLACKK